MSASTRIDLERFVPFRLNRLAAEVSRALAQVYGERFGIDIPEWRVIATLGDRGRARAQDIALSTRMHKSMVSRAVARLMELGWVARNASPTDRREAPLRLTAEGRDIYRQLVPIVLDYQDCLLGSLTGSERRMLERLLDKLERELDLPCRPARPEPLRQLDATVLPEPSRR
ncbi:MAG TPA: MarR family winged helix-turn-helix transcriptional regulator [Geminicoccaceae bacterium]|nr:MarR family winged helix-turn-helix transcriptional regulator [Geminicoccaceae bacterium]